MNNFLIKNPRQQRAIAVLLEKAVSVKDLGPMIGALNPRQVIAELRRQGFSGIIETRRFTVTDQDGKRCRPGEYFIQQDVKPMLEKALIEYAIQTRARCSESTKKLDKTDNNRRE